MTSSYIREANDYFKLHRDFFRNIILEQTYKANIILTIPGVRAVAIDYKNKNSTPRVISKGDYDHVDLIYSIAEKQKIKTVENTIITNFLFENIDINDFVPPEYWYDIAILIARKKNGINPGIFYKNSIFIPYDPVCIELGYGLLSLANGDKDGDLQERVTNARRKLAFDTGVTIPPVRIIDNAELDENEYRISIYGAEMNRSKIKFDSLLCFSPNKGEINLKGEFTHDPVFNLPALWININDREKAAEEDLTIADHASIIVTDLTERCRHRIYDFITMQKTREMLDAVSMEHPIAVEEALNKHSIKMIRKVLINLLKEKVSIRSLDVILEAVADFSSSDAWYLTEKARQALSYQICRQYSESDNTLHVITIDSKLEQKILESKTETAAGIMAALDPETRRAWIKEVGRLIREVTANGWHPVILCSESTRYMVKDSTSREFPELAVLSVPEIADTCQPELAGTIVIDKCLMENN